MLSNARIACFSASVPAWIRAGWRPLGAFTSQASLPSLPLHCSPPPALASTDSFCLPALPQPGTGTAMGSNRPCPASGVTLPKPLHVWGQPLLFPWECNNQERPGKPNLDSFSNTSVIPLGREMGKLSTTLRGRPSLALQSRSLSWGT